MMIPGRWIRTALLATGLAACDDGPDDCEARLPERTIALDASQPEDSLGLVVESSMAEYQLVFEFAKENGTRALALDIGATGDNAADVTLDPADITLVDENTSHVKVDCHGTFPCRAQLQIVVHRVGKNDVSAGTLTVGVSPEYCLINPPDYYLSIRPL